MAGTVIENLSGRKLAFIVGGLLICQLFCFLIGGLMAPIPSGVQTILATICKDIPGAHNDTNVWLYSRGDGRCEPMDTHSLDEMDIQMANRLVYVFQMPLPRGGQVLDFSRWQQNLIGVLQMDITLPREETLILDQQPFNKRTTRLTFDARLAYQNKDEDPTKWTYLASSLEHRSLECHYIDDPHDDDEMNPGQKKSFQQHQNCNPIFLFELGSLHHDYYLLNIRLPIDTAKQFNLNLLNLNHFGRIGEMDLATIYQNGGFTKVWIGLKTVFFPCIVAIMWWFWRRVHILQRSPALLEYMLIYLGSALTLLNLPLEYLTIHFDMPFMLLLGDIRQGVFYATLLSFWLIFAGEHMLIQDSGEKNTLKIYWKHLSAVVVGCVALFIFDMCERGVKLRNPFYSIWMSTAGTKFALTFIIVAGLSACVYFLFLCYMIWRVFCNISLKRTSLPAMSQARRLHYEGIIYRFKFLMAATLLCAGLTIVGFIMGQVADGQFRFDDDHEISIELTSALLTGVYGMWNIYIFSLLILYAPSHKQWPQNNQAGSSNGSGDNNSENNAIVSEEIEFNSLPSECGSPSEISSLTSFARKAAYD